jgi:hypothetical protein
MLAIFLFFLAAILGATSGSATVVDESSRHCWNGGTEISHLDGTVTCSCPFGYAGTNCRTLVDACDSAPCLSGGACVSHHPGYKCQCPTEYHGKDCQHLKNHCLATYTKENVMVVREHPVCGPVGICRTQHGGFSCECLPLAFGDRCEFGPCESEASALCGPHGTCIAVREFDPISCVFIAKSDCKCDSGFMTNATAGELCRQDIDECLSGPCLNAGRCIDEPNAFRCECSWPFGGRQCETNGTRYATDPLRSCRKGGCANNGRCPPQNESAKTKPAEERMSAVDSAGEPYVLQEGDGPAAQSCICPEGFHGRACELIEKPNDAKTAAIGALVIFVTLILLQLYTSLYNALT